MRFPGLTPIGLVELFRTSPGNRQWAPLLPGVDSGNLNDLSDVIAGMAQRAFQRQRHGMRLSTDHDGLLEVFPLQAFERLLQTGPAPLPQLQNFRPAAEGVHKLLVPMPPRLLAVRR